MRYLISIPAVVLLLVGCEATGTKQLERVAKDWSETIRASQVIPVYPLSEDVQVGDVFLVPTSISRQTEIYKEKGFLPIDQLVTRLQGLDFDTFYAADYWDAPYGTSPHNRAKKKSDPVNAPQAAFPSYGFTVDTSTGIKLALPIQGIPVGLGLMRASRAVGTVTLDQTSTYGIDGERAYRKLLDWYFGQSDIKSAFAEMTRLSNDHEVYLRFVTRVYAVRKIKVALANGDSTSAGLDAGAAQDIKLPDLSSQDASKVKDAGTAYSEALNALSSALNGGAAATPGASARFTHVTSRSVSMDQEFDTPLVFGFAGFDVKVFKNGDLSAPIPSFMVLDGRSDVTEFAPVPFATDDGLSDAYIEWLNQDGNRAKMITYLTEINLNRDPADLAFNASLRSILNAAQAKFKF